MLKLRDAGVTLLEIMLVLAIAAVIIVMSVRYYQSASASQQANACLSYLQAVAAAADNLSDATQSYSQITSSEINAIVPRNEAVCNQQGKETLGNSTYQNTERFSINIRLPKQACRLMEPELKASGHWGSDTNKPFNCSIYDYSKGSNIYYFRNKLP